VRWAEAREREREGAWPKQWAGSSGEDEGARSTNLALSGIFWMVTLCGFLSELIVAYKFVKNTPKKFGPGFNYEKKRTLLGIWKEVLEIPLEATVTSS
jgi:hypothetical protein